MRRSASETARALTAVPRLVDVGLAERPRRKRVAERCPCQGSPSHVLNAQLFREALSREHRRADRFNRALVLLRVELGQETPSTRARVLQSLGTVAGDDAIVGWLHDGKELGLLLPDLDLSASAAARDVELRFRQQLGHDLSSPTTTRLPIHTYTHQGGTPVVLSGLDDEPRSRSRSEVWLDATKRALDVVVSLGVLLLCAPLLGVIALAIKATSTGPVFFRQPRVGHGARPFTMLKFRTMAANADSSLHQQFVSGFIRSTLPQEAGNAKWFKLRNDPRITPVGRFLRRSSLDELPQLWNVLVGDMSLVGPRPPLQYEMEQYRPWHLRRVIEAKPGMTGLWQVKGRSRTTFDEMVRLDLRYVRNRSLWLDIKILLATPFAVITGQGAC
jgi:lipopolysaccharide/colanic/teichoic acid biosynthesis glycosyltransferase